MRIAVLVKQVPKFEEMALGGDGRLIRSSVDLELNPYCRRAVNKGVELASETGGECVVLTLGPPAAEDTLREAIAWGADRGVHVCDDKFAGSDTLATARALVSALEREGPFDLVLVGKCSVDADTGQVGPQVAQLLGLSFLGGARELEVAPQARIIRARCEDDEGYTIVTTTLPALVSTAERLCEPAKVPAERRAAVDAALITRVSAALLRSDRWGSEPWGVAGSPTVVGELRFHGVMRRRVVLAGSVAEQAAELARLLREQGLLDGDPDRRNRERSERVPETSSRDVGRRVAVYLELDRPDANRELLGRAAAVAADVDGRVVALTWRSGDAATLASWGADDVVALTGSDIEQDVAAALAAWCADTRPWAFLLPGTASGREIAGRVAAELGLGLTGDAIDISANGEVLVAWKPAFGGQLVAAITTRSDVQMATVRPGVLPIWMPRSHHAATTAAASIDIVPTAPTRRIEVVRDDKLGLLNRAERVIAVGAAVPPETYSELEELRRLLNAELGGTRKVTDKGWLPRARQIGITGRSISPHLFLSIGASGKFNHIIGACGAHLLVAINNDPDALIFGAADIGIVGDWREVVPLLVSALEKEMARAQAELR